MGEARAAAFAQLACAAEVLLATEIAVAARLRQPAAGVQQARPGGQPFVKGQGVAEVGPARVADGGEPAIQHLAQRTVGEGGQILRTPAQELQDIEVGRPDVHVGVDQPRHQGAAAEIHQLTGLRAGNGALRDLLDQAVRHQDLGAAHQLWSDAVEHGCVGEQDRVHCPSAV